MARYSNERPQTTHDMLSNYTVSELKQLGAHLRSEMKRLNLSTTKHSSSFNASSLPTRKTDLVAWILAPLQDSACLQELYRHISALEQAALQEAVHTHDGTFDGFKFKAKYGSVPQTRLPSSYWSYNRRKDADTSTLALFFFKGTMLPPDLQTLFTQFVPQPRAGGRRTPGKPSGPQLWAGG